MGSIVDIDKAAQNLSGIGVKGAPPSTDSSSDPKAILVIIENRVFEHATSQLLIKCMGNLNRIVRCVQGNDQKEREINLIRELRLSTTIDSPYTHVICIADGDDAPKEQYENIYKFLIAEDYHTTTMAIQRNGAEFLANDKPKVGVWIMPNNKDVGTFADFYLTSALPDNRILQSIEDVLNKNKEEKLIKYKKSYHGMAKFFTYLAWQKNPARSDEDLFNEDKFNIKNELFITFKLWLSQVLK